MDIPLLAGSPYPCLRVTKYKALEPSWSQGILWHQLVTLSNFTAVQLLNPSFLIPDLSCSIKASL